MSEMRKIQEVYIAHDALGSVGHTVCIRRGAGEGRSERWYGVWRKVTESSLNRLHRVIRSRAGNDEWTVNFGIYRGGMYIYLKR